MFVPPCPSSLIWSHRFRSPPPGWSVPVPTLVQSPTSPTRPIDTAVPPIKAVPVFPSNTYPHCVSRSLPYKPYEALTSSATHPTTHTCGFYASAVNIRCLGNYMTDEGQPCLSEGPRPAARGCVEVRYSDFKMHEGVVFSPRVYFLLLLNSSCFSVTVGLVMFYEHLDGLGAFSQQTHMLHMCRAVCLFSISCTLPITYNIQ